MNRTTIKLRLTLADQWRIHERTIRDASAGAALIVALLLMHTLLRPAPVAPQALPKPDRPVIVLATARPLPTWTPAPTLTPVVVVREVVITAPTPEPQVIYVAVETPPEPTAAPVQPSQAPMAQLAVLDRAAWAVAAATAKAEQ